MGKSKRPYPRNTARKLKLIRLRLGLSQTQIAARLKVENRAQISAYETGARECPITLLLKYAKLARIRLETIVDDRLKLPWK